MLRKPSPSPGDTHTHTGTPPTIKSHDSKVQRRRDESTSEVCEVVFVGAGEASHGAIAVLLKEPHVLSAGQQPLPGGPHQEDVGVVLLLTPDPRSQLLHQQISAWHTRRGLKRRQASELCGSSPPLCSLALILLSSHAMASSLVWEASSTTTRGVNAAPLVSDHCCIFSSLDHLQPEEMLRVLPPPKVRRSCFFILI